MTVAKNIRVMDLMRVLGTYEASQFVDIGIILGKNSEPDQIKIFKTDKYNNTTNSEYKKFEFKNLNDYI